MYNPKEDKKNLIGFIKQTCVQTAKDANWIPGLNWKIEEFFFLKSQKSKNQDSQPSETDKCCNKLILELDPFFDIFFSQKILDLDPGSLWFRFNCKMARSVCITLDLRILRVIHTIANVIV